MKNKLHNKNITVDKLYFILSLGLLAFAIAIIAISKGKSFDYLFWHGDSIGFYPDLFESVIHARTRDPYKIDAIYPAFAYCIIYFFNWFVPGKYVNNFDDLGKFCSHTEALVIAHVFYALVTVTIAYLIIKTFGDKKYIGKYLVVLIFLTSAPFLFLIERGNTVIITIVFLFVYLLYYDSENKKLKELALICLACAAAMKLYPAVFGLLLISDKKWKDSIKAVIYGLLLFVVPFVFMGGIGQIPSMLANSLTLNSNTLSGSTGFGYGFKVNPSSTISCVFNWLTGNNYVVIIKMAVYFLVGLLLCSTLSVKDSWKKAAALSLVVILMPDFSFIYNVIYLLPAMILFIKDMIGKKVTLHNLLYTLCFVGAFAPLPYGDIFRSIGGYNNMNWGTLICSLSLVLLGVMIGFEGIVEFFKNNKKIVLVGVLVASLVIGLVPYGLTLRSSEPKIQTLDDVWTLTAEEELGVNKLYDTIKDSNEDIICFPRVETLSVFDKLDNVKWYSPVEKDDSFSSDRIINKTEPQYIVIDTSNYSNYKQYVSKSKNKEEKYKDVITLNDYQQLMTMQNDLIKYINEENYHVLAYVPTENNRYIAVWQKDDSKADDLQWNNGGTGTKNDPYTISTTDQYLKFVDVSNCGYDFEDEYIKLSNNLDFSGCGNLKPVARFDSVADFKGVFDGNGYTMSNIKMEYVLDSKYDYANVALFNYLEGMVLNLTVENSSFKGASCAVFAKVSMSKKTVVANCISKNNRLEASIRVGEIADKYGAYVVNCLAMNNELIADRYVGFVSLKGAYPVLKNCYTTKTDSLSGVSVLSEEGINSQFMVDAMNESSVSYVKMQKAYNAQLKKKDKKKREKIPTLNQWILKDGMISISHSK